ncbi:MAG: GNAT family N-acetyltransferase [Clostridia bacterium]|nr:GNAT family N-acetyltransferase [Clostridia bacterium]
MKAEKSDLKALRELWEYCFYEDSKEFLDFYFGALDTDCVRVIKDGGKIVSCLHLQDIEICQGGKKYKAAYIGGVATSPSYRNRGYYKRLMTETLEELTQSGYDAAVLIPFSYDFYRKDGFEVSSYYIEVSGKSQDIGKSKVVTENKYDAYWNRTAKELEDIKKALAPEGVKFFEGDGFHIFYYFKDGDIIIPELAADTGAGYENGISFIASQEAYGFKLRTDLARAARFSEKCFDIKLCPHTMMKILNPDFVLSGVYNNNFNFLGYV